MTDIELAVSCALVGWVYSNIFLSAGHIFHPFYLFLDRLRGFRSDPENLINDGPLTGIAKALGLCDICISSQLFFWIYLIRRGAEYGSADLWRHICGVSLTALIVYLLQYIRHENRN